MGSSVRRHQATAQQPSRSQRADFPLPTVGGHSNRTPQPVGVGQLWRLAIATIGITTLMVGLSPRAALGQTQGASVTVAESRPESRPSPEDGAWTVTPAALQEPLLLAQSAAPSAHLLFVNPALGNDTSGEGSQRSPFRTITHALEVAPAGTTIFLAAGTYSAESGEQFPIRLRPGITLQGDVGSRGQGILIRGGGEFLSPTAARQNITLLGANEATLTGITVTNPNVRGYGLWIESSSPTVLSNTFSGNLHDGIAVNGTSQAVIRNNRFHRNGANGISIYGTAQPLVADNLFEETGYGVNVGQRAAPQLVGNQIVRNRSGVIVQGSARPVLRQNVIEQNEQDGVVAIAQAVPDMGTTAEPGENQIQGNGRQDVNADVAQQEIPIAGNQLDQSRTSGSLDFSGEVAIAPAAAPSPRSASAQFPRIVLPFTVPPARANVPETPTPPPVQQATTPTPPSAPAATPAPPPPAAPSPAIAPTPFPQPTAIAPTESAAATTLTGQSATGGSRPPSTSLEMFVQPTAAAIAPQPSRPATPPTVSPAATPPPALITTAPIPIPVVAPQTAPSPPAQPLRATAAQPQTVSVAARPSAASQAPIPIPVIFPNTQATNPAPALIPAVAAATPIPATPVPSTPVPATPIPATPTPQPVRNANLLPVPAASVPTGHLGGLQTIRVANGALTPMTDAQRASMLGLRYRVVVEAGNERMQNAVRSLIPGAFRTRVDGRTVMQAGAFASLENANSVARQLVNSGLRAEVQTME
ncbi:MAG: DUF1565 domain-containing protein [Synechococcales bacterium]|nr:DUF1565 domain-containing protein [Synechococcales bacterium]